MKLNEGPNNRVLRYKLGLFVIGYILVKINNPVLGPIKNMMLEKNWKNNKRAPRFFGTLEE